MSIFAAVVQLMVAAGAKNADPVGPNDTPQNVTVFASDPEKGWYDCTWTNGDSTAYTQISENNKVSVSRTYSPGVTESGVGGSMYWTIEEVNSGDLWIRHSKNGLYSDWVGIGLVA